MNIMITGCAGFIGSHAVDLFLSKGYRVVGVDKMTYASNYKNLSQALQKKKFKFIQCGIEDKDTIKHVCSAHEIEWIINFAAETHVDNSIVSADPFVVSNVLGVIKLLEVCSDLKIKILHVSTDEVYGDAEVEQRFSEDDILNPRNPYSASKAAAEHFVNAFANTYGVEFLMVRPSNNFGPRQHNEKLIPKIIDRLMRNEKVPVYGDGKQSREWTYVEDTVRGIEFILKNSPLNQIYNLTSEFERRNIDTVSRVVELVLKKDSHELISFVKDRPGHDKRYSISQEKLANLGWQKYTDDSEALFKTVKFYTSENL